MTKQNIHIDRLFKDKLSHHEVAPSSKAWERIQGSKTSRGWLWWLLPLLLLGGFVGYRSMVLVSHSPMDKAAVLAHEPKGWGTQATNVIAEPKDTEVRTNTSKVFEDNHLNPMNTPKEKAQSTSEANVKSIQSKNTKQFAKRRSQSKSKAANASILADASLDMIGSVAVSEPISSPIDSAVGLSEKTNAGSAIRFADENSETSNAPRFKVSVNLGQAGSAEESAERLPIDPKYMKEAPKNPFVRAFQKVSEWVKNWRK